MLGAVNADNCRPGLVAGSFPARLWEKLRTGLTVPARIRLAFLAILLAQGIKVERLIPAETLANGDPLVEYHYSQFYVDAMHDRQFRAVSGRSWGYDPFVGAGQPTGAGLVHQSHALIAFDRLMRPFVRVDTSIKLFVWLTVGLGPTLLFFAGVLAGFGAVPALIAMLLATAGSLVHDPLSRTLIYGGEISFWFGCYLAVLNAAAFYAGAFLERRAGWAIFVVTTALLPMFDPVMSAVQIAPLATIFLFAPARQQRVALVWGAFAAVVAAGANLFWIRPFWLFHDVIGTATDWTSPGLRALEILFSPMRNQRFAADATARTYLVVFAAAEMAIARPEHRRHWLVLGVWASLLLLLGMYGSSLPLISKWKPGRLLFPILPLLAIPAGCFIARVFAKRGSVRLPAVLWLLWLLASWQTVNRDDPRPIRDDLSVRERHLLADLKDLPPNQRVLIQYDPYLTDALRFASLDGEHCYAGFSGAWADTSYGSSALFVAWDRKQELFGMPLSSRSPAELASLLTLYNVGWIVATSPETRGFFSAMRSSYVEMPRRKGATEEDGYWIFRAAEVAPNGFVPIGRGQVTPGYDRLRVRAAGPEPMVLSFHWVKGMTVPAPARISPVRVRGDDVPLIGIENHVGLETLDVTYAAR